MRKSAHVVLKDSGDENFEDVQDVVVHGSGALMVVLGGERGVTFAPGTWTRGQVTQAEQTEGDSQES